MKKSKFSVLMYVLALMLVMYNCKKKEEPFPTEPSGPGLEELNGVKIDPITPTPPAEVTTVPGSVAPSPEGAAVSDGLGSIATTGVVPASITTAATAVTAALPAADVATLAAVTPATVSAIAAGGAVPAELKAIMDKVAANPALQAYLPKITLPTVNGVSISGRIGAVEAINAVESVLVEDACLVSAEAKFQAKKTELDAAKAVEDGKVATTYSNAIAPLAAAEASCKSSIPAAMAAYRAAIQAQIDKAHADLELAKPALGDLYPVLAALINIQAIGAFAGLPALEAASINACTATTTAKTAAAQAARDADLAKITTAYNTAIAAASAARAKLIESCHNQGGGQ
jgi:hypothetical protein